MSTPALEITEPGMLTTVQDRGRYGYQRSGVPVSGAMDEFALRAANLLVGNDQSAACLEMTVLGPTIRTLTDTWIAVTGADLSPQIDGEPVRRWQTVAAPAGSLLSFGEMKDGMRAYLAVAGGIDVPLVMGSRSTYVKAAIGGLDGRELRAGDVISTLPVGQDAPPVNRGLPDGYGVPTYGEHHEVRVVLGPQYGAFSTEALATLLSSKYVISVDSDRMGYRLEGPTIEHRTGPDIVSDGNPMGAIQVPGDGVPTILLADRGTTGGYTKIATVISTDIGKLAQAVSGQSVSFKAVTVQEAHQVLRESEAILTAMTTKSKRLRRSLQKLDISVDGQTFEVEDEDGRTVTQRLGESAHASSHNARATTGGHSYKFQVEVRREE